MASFTVYDLSDGAPVGTAGLITIDWRLSRATFGIAIGERRGTGLGTEATRLTLDWAFNMLGLHNVMLTVLPTNTAAIRAYEKAGFKRIGLRRDALCCWAARGDEVLMDAVADEFESPCSPRAAELLEAQLAQLGPARVGRALVRVPGLVVEVRAALRAQARAVLAADDLVGQRERVGVARPLGEVEHAVRRRRGC